uniref:Uncharacterized protein n=1 Tax=Medicago truncatula TaxID=3880 RepID=I3SE85_MEDTR|nr:unknown [Medicago truncatula]
MLFSISILFLAALSPTKLSTLPLIPFLLIVVTITLELDSSMRPQT